MDDYDVPVICYGLRPLRGESSPAARGFLPARIRSRSKTICWCGKKATNNARLDGRRHHEGRRAVVLGASDKYIGLCRKHDARDPGPGLRAEDLEKGAVPGICGIPMDGKDEE